MNDSYQRIKRVFILSLLSLFVVVVSVTGTWYLIRDWQPYQEKNNPVEIADEEKETAQEVIAARPVEVVLKKTYVCGVEEEERLTKQVRSANDLFRQYEDWDLLSAAEDQLVFHKNIQDISPMCKKNGYFGLSEDGTLTLYNGLPENDRVIKTFFHINTEKLESSLPIQEVTMLKEGIPVRDIAVYNSVLSTYGEFSDEKQAK